MRISKIVKNLKDLGRLKVEDEQGLAEKKLALFEFIENHPVRETAITRQYNSSKPDFSVLRLIFKPMAIIAGILIVAFLAGGGTACAAQGSLPGDALYPIKLVTEDMQIALAFNPEKKVDLEAKFANRRLEELQKLQKKIQKRNGEIPHEVIEKAMERAEERLKKAEEHITKMEGGSRKDEALRAASRLDEALETHERILSELTGEVPAPAQSALLRAQEMSAKRAEKTLQTILKLEKVKEIEKKFEENKTLGKIVGAAERAEGKLKAVENRLEALEKSLENLKEQGAEISEDVEVKLDGSRNKIEEAKKLIEEDKYLESFEAAHEAMRSMMKIILLLRQPILLRQ